MIDDIDEDMLTARIRGEDVSVRYEQDEDQVLAYVEDPADGYEICGKGETAADAYEDLLEQIEIELATEDDDLEDW